MRGFEAIPKLIRATGTTTVFGMLGGTNVQWISDGVRKGAFTFARTRHEETSVSAATAFARVTGGLGVCTVTRGPGFANSVNAMVAAVHDHVPVLLVVAESPATRTRTTQNLDQRAITTAIGAGFIHVRHPSELAESFAQAVRFARWNGQPQVLSIGDGVTDAEVEWRGLPASEALAAPDAIAVKEAVTVIGASRRPLVLAGQGAQLADAREPLEELAGLIGAEVASTLNVNRFFSGHPNDLGVVGDSTPPVVWKRLDEVDVVVSFGASLNEYTTSRGRLLTNAAVIQCEIDDSVPTPVASRALRISADARRAAVALVNEWRDRGLPTRVPAGDTPSLEDVQRSVLNIGLNHSPDRGVDLRDIYRVLDSKLPRDRIVISDSGRRKATMPTLVDAPDGRSWLVTRGYGSIGLGLGAAVGAAAAAPDRPVVLFCGDGGFMMAAQDLDAIRINKQNVTIVIANDQQYGSERVYLKKYDLPVDVIQQDLPHTPDLAKAFGGRGVVVSSLDELEALELPGSGLFIVEVRVDPEVDWAAIYK